MSAIPLTVFFSLLLAGSFVALFVREQRRRKFASAERDSLLPLADETPRLAASDDFSTSDNVGREFPLVRQSLGDGGTPPLPIRKQAGFGNPALQSADHDHAHDDHDHDDEHHHHEGKGNCGCRDGTRPPCTGCLRRTGTDKPVSPVPSSRHTFSPPSP